MQIVTVNELTFDEYLSEQEIASLVKDVASRINADYAGKEPLFICVLNGAFMYASDLFKQITVPAEITFVRLKSYEGTATTGKVNMLIPLQVPVEGRDVIIVEDIVDTGLTMHGFMQQLREAGVASGTHLFPIQARCYQICGRYAQVYWQVYSYQVCGRLWIGLRRERSQFTCALHFASRIIYSSFRGNKYKKSSGIPGDFFCNPYKVSSLFVAFRHNVLNKKNHVKNNSYVISFLWL